MGGAPGGGVEGVDRVEDEAGGGCLGYLGGLQRFELAVAYQHQQYIGVGDGLLQAFGLGNAGQVGLRFVGFPG